MLENRRVAAGALHRSAHAARRELPQLIAVERQGILTLLLFLTSHLFIHHAHRTLTWRRGVVGALKEPVARLALHVDDPS